MRKFLGVLMVCVFMVSLTACGSCTDSEQPEESVTSPMAENVEQESTEIPPTALGNMDESSAEQSDTEEPFSQPEESVTNALVVYFSSSGNTKSVAEAIAAECGADLYEIVPEQPYTDDDLNYNDRDSRSTVEMNDPDSRPVIAGEGMDLSVYDVVYVGYPIWWGDMPRILYTFFDTYDLSGKTIAPFCTSGGSGLSGTPGTIAGLEPEATVTDGLHIGSGSASAPEAAVTEWLDEIGFAR